MIKKVLEETGLIFVWSVQSSQGNSFPSVLMSLMMNLPFVSEYSRRIWKKKLLLKRIAMPPLALEQQLKSDL